MAYHTQCNGQVEQFHQTLFRMIQHLPELLQAYNSARSVVTGCSPPRGQPKNSRVELSPSLATRLKHPFYEGEGSLLYLPQFPVCQILQTFCTLFMRGRGAYSTYHNSLFVKFYKLFASVFLRIFGDNSHVLYHSHVHCCVI